ncbi:MAG TPA: hypothetical protein VKN18_33280 [Blastocatellia bacterium]|nr:hypothetical protein [Blastocatellia bacterium]
MRYINDRLANILWHLAAILTFWSFGYTALAAGDLWWHLAAGRLIVQTRAITLVDPWSFTRASAPWRHHEWLSDVVYYFWENAFGMAALVYWKWITIAAVFLILMKVCQRLGKELIFAYISTVFNLAVAAPFLDIRPHLYSLLGYSIILLVSLREDRPIPLWLPGVFLLWVNLHGGFLFGLMAVAVIIACSPYLRRNMIVFLLCVLACFVNPNGFHAFLYPLRYAFDKSSPYALAIGEWASPLSGGGISSPLYPYAIAIFVISVCFLVYKGAYRNRVVVMVIALGILTIAMSLASRRFIPLFASSEALTIAVVLRELLGTKLRRVPTGILPSAAFICALLLIWPYPKSVSAFQYLTDEDQFPIEVCNFIESNNLKGNVFAYYNWGGYLHLRTGGGMKVFLDGRADTVYDDQTVLQYARVQGFKDGWQQVIDSSGADFILWPRDRRGSPMAELVQAGRWQPLYDDAVSVLLVRSDSVPAERLKPTPDSGYKRLALGVKLFEKREYDSAEEETKRAITMLPGSSFACHMLADIFRNTGRTGQGESQERKCKKCFPTR